jgi:hypothetical protein
MKNIIFILLIFTSLFLFSCQANVHLEKSQVLYGVNAALSAKATQCKESLKFVAIVAMNNVTAENLQSCQSLILAESCPMTQNLPFRCINVAFGIKTQ